MLKLIRMSEEKYAVVSSPKEEWFMGARAEMLSKLYMLGLENEEIAHAVGELILNEHHIAHFGVNGTFIFSEAFSLSEVNAA